MAYQAAFKRYELKYLLTNEQHRRILEVMGDYMALDRYGRTTIRNLYYDTPNYRLIRHSLEKPAYKEKLRLRSYSRVEDCGSVFVEMKKKYGGVVYKRRIRMPYGEAVEWLDGGAFLGERTQIVREIDYCKQYYGGLKPKVFLSYDREAWFCKAGTDLRITFDDAILCRRDGLSLAVDPGGVALLPENTVLMEIKTAGAVPLWMTNVLTREGLFKTSFSKYGTGYEKLILPNFKGECLYV